MSEFSARPIVVTLPLSVYDALAELAEDEPVEGLAATLLAEVVQHGAPAELRRLLRLMTQVADLQSNKWDERRGKLQRLRARLERITAELSQLNHGA
jgi:hypothetical protein